MTARFLSDDRLWPIVVQVAEGLQDMALHARMLSAWDASFQRGAGIVMLRIYLDSAALEHASGVAKATKAWMQAGAAEAIRRHVTAMPIVVPPSDYETMRDLDVFRVFGVRGGIFPHLDEACAWLRRAELPAPDPAIVAGIIDPR